MSKKEKKGLNKTYAAIGLGVMFLVVLAMLILGEENPVAIFMANPIVSFIGWAVSLIAGSIAIFEFLAHRELKKEHVSLKQEYHRVNNLYGNSKYVERMRDMTIINGKQ